MEQAHAANPEAGTQWMNTSEAARFLRASRSYVRKLIALKLIKASNIGTSMGRAEWRISRGELEKFLASRVG